MTVDFSNPEKCETCGHATPTYERAVHPDGAETVAEHRKWMRCDAYGGKLLTRRDGYCKLWEPREATDD